MNKPTQNNSLSKQEKQSINYFIKSDILKFIGAGVLIAGLLCLWLGRFGMIGIILAILGTPTGLILFLIGSSGRASDEDMESNITNKMAGLHIEIDNDRHYHLKLLKHHKEHVIEGYIFNDDVLMKKLKDGSIRTSEFNRAKLRILSDSLYIISREISLICKDVVNTTYEISYDDISKIEICREQKRVIFNKTTFFTKPCNLHIVTPELDLYLPIVDAITADELVDSIKRQMQIYNESK